MLHCISGVYSVLYTTLKSLESHAQNWEEAGNDGHHKQTVHQLVLRFTVHAALHQRGLQCILAWNCSMAMPSTEKKPVTMELPREQVYSACCISSAGFTVYQPEISRWPYPARRFTVYTNLKSLDSHAQHGEEAGDDGHHKQTVHQFVLHRQKNSK
jgi:hypothetical protein